MLLLLHVTRTTDSRDGRRVMHVVSTFYTCGQLRGRANFKVTEFHVLHNFIFFFSDLASQMFELALAFKKYEVTSPPCQRYVACEASQETRIEQNGPLATLVNRIMK